MADYHKRKTANIKKRRTKYLTDEENIKVDAFIESMRASKGKKEAS